MPYNPPRRPKAQHEDGHTAFRNFMNQTNDSSSSVNSRRKFYLGDNGSASSVSSLEERSPANASKNSLSTPDPLPLPTGFPQNRMGRTNMPTKPSPDRSPTENAAIQFTTTSPQSYSYALMSPNSMALRLKVLKRSLEILMERPEWLNSNVYTEGLDSPEEPIIVPQAQPGSDVQFNSPFADTTLSSQFSQRVSSPIPVPDRDEYAISSSVSSPMGGSPTSSIISPPFSPQLAPRMSSMASARRPIRRASTAANVMDNVFKLERINSSHALSSALQSARARGRDPPQASAHPFASTVSYKRIPPNAVTAHTAQSKRHPPTVTAPPVIGSVSVDKSLLEDLKQIINFLESGVKPDLTADQASKMINLHNLSLSNGEHLPKKAELKIQLLHALATPFEDSGTNNAVAGIPLISTTASTWGLSTLDQASNTSSIASGPPLLDRQFHAGSAGKTKSPKAIFTCELDSPWALLNSNDLACLMFGISRSRIKSLTLMDLIAPRSRNMAAERLLRDVEQVFAGQVVAIKRTSGDIAWTSLWAKRKDSFMILIFEQIPCDSVDILITKDKSDEKYSVESLKTNSSMFSNTSTDGLMLKGFIPSMNSLVQTRQVPENYLRLPPPQKDSELINKVRYFSVSTDSGFAPCAASSDALEPDDDECELRINIHSLPYMAGSFVVSSNGYKVVSFNEAIAKNMFGRADLPGKSIRSILPTFPELVDAALQENPALMYEAGLVLPEHYFRKLDAYRKGKTDDEKELLFLQSKGIEGHHNDGHSIVVDVQMRIIDQDYFLLWLTYCRTIAPMLEKSDSGTSLKDITQKIEETQKSIEKEKETTSPSSKQKQVSISYDRIGDVPSQLPLFSEVNFDNTSNSSAEMSRSSTQGTERSDELSSSTSIPSEISSKDFHLVNVLTTKQLLERENTEIDNIRKHSKYFPKDVGLERRTKKMKDFHVVKNLGQGAYGKVVVAERNNDPLYTIVLKAIFKDRILVDTWVRDKKLGTIPSEIQILNTIDKDPHPNIMRIVDFFEDDNCYYLETLQHGDPPAIDLFDLIEVKSDMSEQECKYIYFQCCSAMAHLHKKGIVHRDIKDENIIVDQDFVAKLIDFGSAAYTKDGPFGVFVGTIDYAAPEVLNGSPYNGKPQDVWAMGVLLYTLVFKENPFTSVDEILEGNLTFPRFDTVSPECVELIKSILVEDANKRPSMKDILNSKWLEGFV